MPSPHLHPCFTSSSEVVPGLSLPVSRSGQADLGSSVCPQWTCAELQTWKPPRDRGRQEQRRRAGERGGSCSPVGSRGGVWTMSQLLPATAATHWKHKRSRWGSGGGGTLRELKAVPRIHQRRQCVGWRLLGAPPGPTLTQGSEVPEGRALTGQWVIDLHLHKVLPRDSVWFFPSWGPWCNHEWLGAFIPILGHLLWPFVHVTVAPQGEAASPGFWALKQKHSGAMSDLPLFSVGPAEDSRSSGGKYKALLPAPAWGAVGVDIGMTWATALLSSTCLCHGKDGIDLI